MLKIGPLFIPTSGHTGPPVAHGTVIFVKWQFYHIYFVLNSKVSDAYFDLLFTSGLNTGYQSF